ncbi:MAG: CPBP family intramembrane glutamic endopeptidase [Asticcacaulis sp.]
MSGTELYAPHNPRYRRTWSAAIVIIGLMFTLFGPLLALSPYIFHLVMEARTLGGADRLPDPELLDPPVLALIIGYSLYIIFIYLWVRVFERRSLSDLGLSAPVLKRIGQGYLMGCLYLTVVIAIISGLGGYQIQSAGIWHAPNPAGLVTLLLYALMFLIQGSSEELWMRGWLMSNLASRHGLISAVVVNSLVFAGLHIFTHATLLSKLLGITNVALFGGFLSLYALRAGSIWGVCGFHAAWNWMMGVGFGLEVTGLKLRITPLFTGLNERAGEPWWLTGGHWGAEASLVTTGVLLAGIVWHILKGALKAKNLYSSGDNKPVRASMHS